MLEREIREMAFVPRWSIVRTNRQQYLAEHTYFVCMYANDIAVYLGWSMDEIGKLLQMCLWHDVEEIFSGDIPGPCKRAGMGTHRVLWDKTLFTWLGNVFYKLAERSGACPRTKFRIPDEVFEAVVKLADMIDECCEMGTEIQMGNRTVDRVFDDSAQRVMQALDNLAKVEPALKSGPAFTKLRTVIGSTLIEARHGESKSTKIFNTL